MEPRSEGKTSSLKLSFHLRTQPSRYTLNSVRTWRNMRPCVKCFSVFQSLDEFSIRSSQGVRSFLHPLRRNTAHGVRRDHKCYVEAFHSPYNQVATLYTSIPIFGPIFVNVSYCLAGTSHFLVTLYALPPTVSTASSWVAPTLESALLAVQL